MNLKGYVHFPSTVAVPFFLLSLLGSIGRTDAVIDCGNCFCSEDVVTGYQNVICLGVPFAEIKNTFAGNAGLFNINRLSIVPELGDTQIPAGLLGIHTARIIHLASCGDNLMKIRPNAFKSSAATMGEFFVYDCNVGSLTWFFLEGFTKVNLLHLEGVTNIQSLGNLPSLPSLKWLSIIDCEGFSSLNFPGSSLGGLQNLVMTENVELTDGKAESILATLYGASKLEIVSLKNNPYISRIPNTLANLVALHSLDVSLCDINSISSGSLSFSADVQLLDLTKNFLLDIPNNAFEKGYYGNAKVSLDGNQLTKFSSTVFLKILTEMQTSKTPGSVSIRNNPVKCDDCLIAWLIRDYRELLPFVSGQCSNATDFQDLNPSWYDDQLCKSLLTATTTSTSSTISTSTTTPQSTTTFNPTTTLKPTSQTEPPTMSTASASVPDKSEIPTSTGSTTAVQVTTTSSATDSTLTSSGTTMPSTGSQPETSDFSSTTTTAKIPNSSTTSTPSIASSSGSSTTQAPDPPAEINYDIYFYILYGVLGGIALILIFGFLFLDYKRRRALKARTSLDDSISRGSSLSRRMDPENYNPRSLEQRNVDSRPPASRQNDLGNYQQSRGQPYANPVSITTPYRQQPPINQPPPAPPTGRVRGLRRAGF